MGLSNLLSELLEPIAGEMRGRVERGFTENTLNDVDRYNEMVDGDFNREMARSLVNGVVTRVTGKEQTKAMMNKVGKGKEEEFQGPPRSEVLIGMDALALYPSISTKVAMDECKKAAMESEIGVRNLNYMEATRLLALCLDKEQIEKEGLRGLFPKRRPTAKGGKTRNLKLTTANSMGPRVNDQTKWCWPRVNLSHRDKGKISGMVVVCLVQIFCET